MPPSYKFSLSLIKNRAALCMQAWWRSLKLTRRIKFLSSLKGYLHKIDSNVTFEFAPIDKNGIRELFISADGMRESFPVVKRIVSKAPKLPKWKITAFRQRDMTCDLKIKYDDFQISSADIYFRYAEEAKKIAVELNIKNYSGSASQQNATYILLDALLGEYDTEMELSSIEWVPLDTTKINKLLPYRDLRKVVDLNKKHFSTASKSRK